MSSYSGANTRVSIPNTIRKMIQDIKEISGDHSDDDVYAMLKECSMDPNETAQRLLFLDTFHEVKRKRDKRKENVNGRVSESSRRKPGNQVRGARSGRNFSSQYTSKDAGGERAAAVWKENGSEDNRDRVLKSPALPVLKEEETKTLPSISKSAPMNGPTWLPNGGLNDGHVVQHPGTGDTVCANHIRDAGLVKPESTLPLAQTKVNAVHEPSAADIFPVPMQSCDSQLPTAVATIKSEEENHEIAADSKDSAVVERGLCNTHELADQTQTNEDGSGKVEASQVSSSRRENSEHKDAMQPMMNGESLGSERLPLSPVPESASAVQPSLPNASAVEEVTTELEKLKFAEVQHVILPNHIQVPDAVKNVLSFGSLNTRSEAGVTDVNSSVSNKNSNQASELLEGECAKQPESCDEGTPNAQEENYLDPPQDPSHVPETILPPENNFQAPKDDQLKQETMPAVGPPYPVLQTTPTYGYGFMPPMLGSPLVQIEGLDHQARLLNSMIGNSLALSTLAPSPPIQSAGAVQSSAAVSTQSLPLIRQPYPPNFIPYAHYFPPFFVPPTLQYLGHGSFPPHIPSGNMYLPPVAAASGMKVSPPYKPGTNLGNQGPVGMPSGAFGVHGSPQVGYNPNAVVTSGSSNANVDHMPSVLKEGNVYPEQQSEGSTVWIPAPGRDSTTLPVNSFFNLPPQSQHVTISPQSGHGPFAAMYHPLQTIAAPRAAQPGLVQQSESMAGPVESVGTLPPTNSFQQPPQRQQMNWNSGF